MVRFLCTCERPLVNQNLLLLDLLAVLQLDLDRLLVRVKARPPALLTASSSPHKLSHASSMSSPRRPLSPPPPSSPSSSVVVPYEGPASLEPLFVFPQAKRRRDSSLRRAAQKQRGPFKLEAAALLLMPQQQQQNNGQPQQSGGTGSGGGWASSSSSSLRRRSDGEYSWWTRSLKRSALLGAGLLERSASMGPPDAGGGGGSSPQEQQQQAQQEGGGRDDEAEEEAALRACKTKTLPSRLSSSSSSLRSSMSDVFGDDATTMANNHATPSTAPPATTGSSSKGLSGGSNGSERDLSALLLPPMSRRTMAMAEHLTSVATAGTTSPPKRPASGAPSGSSSSSGGQDAARSAHHHHHQRTDPSSGGAVQQQQQQQLSVDDGSLVRQLWQSLFLVRRQCGAYSLAHSSMAELRDNNRAALKTLVLQMKGLRAKTGQAPAADFTYDELLGRAQASADRAAAKELHQHNNHQHQHGHQAHQAPHCACSAPQHLSLGARLLVDRLKLLVFVLQLDDGLVFSYSPHTGLRHLQRIHPPPTTIAATPPDASAAEVGGVRRGRASSSVGGQQQPCCSPPAHSSKRSTGGDPTTSNEASSAQQQQQPPPCSSLISPELRSLLQEMSVEGAREKSLGGGLAKRAHTLDSCFLAGGSSSHGNGGSPSGSSGGGGPRSSCSSSSMGHFLSRVLATVAQQQQQRQKQAEAGAKPGASNNDEQQQQPVVPPAPLPSEGGARKRSVSSSVGLPRQIMASLFGTATAAQHDASSSAQQQQQAGSSPVVAPVPCCLTLVCSKYLHYLPWEVAVHAPPPSAPPSADGQPQQQVVLSATRYLCLHSLVNTPLEQLAAKARPASVPELFGFFWRGKEADVRARQARVGAAAVERALWELRQPPSSDPEASLRHPHHAHAPVVAAPQDEHKPSSRAANAPATSSSSSTFRLLRRMPRLASDSLQADMWPLTTPPLPLATSSTSSSGLRLKLGRHKKRHITFFDASQAGTNLYATLSWLDSHSKDCCGHQLPVFLFSYADLARLSDALLCLLHNRPDVVALFVPPCSGDVLIKEVSARREAALAAGRKSLYSSRSRRGSTSSSTDSRSRAGENVATGQRQHAGSSSSSSVKRGAPSDASSSSVSCRASSRPGRHDTPSAAAAGGSSVYEILAEAVQAVRVKHQLPVVAFNL